MIRTKMIVTGCLIFLAAANLGAEPAAKPEKKGFGISISPSVIRLKSAKGQSQSASVKVFNNGGSAAQVLTEVSDVGNSVDAKGKLTRQFSPAGTLPYSCAKWTLLRENEFPLNPGEAKDVHFIVSPPADSSGGFACVVFMRAVPPVPEKSADATQDKTQATIQVQPRLGAMVFYELEGTVKRTGKLVDLKYEPPKEGNPLKIFYIFKNTGNTDILLSGTFYILDSNKALAAKGDLDPVRTFPGDQGYGETQWTGNLASGTYHLVVSLELGPDTQEVIVKELDFSIP